jgi:hypothetical protein
LRSSHSQFSTVSGYFPGDLIARIVSYGTISEVSNSWWYSILALVAAGMLAWIAREIAQVGSWFWGTQSARVELEREVSDALSHLSNDIYVLHVRDIADPTDSRARLRNRSHRFRRSRRTGRLVARWRCNRLLGCQFKCHLEQSCVPRKSQEEMIEALKAANFLRPTRDVHSVRHPDSYYFLLSDYDATSDGPFENNIYPPRPLRH